MKYYCSITSLSRSIGRV